MQWTDKQIGTMRKLASEGFTRRETADKLGISYDAVQKKSRRLGIEFQSPMPNEYDSDGTHTTYTIRSHLNRVAIFMEVIVCYQS